eukprot:scaffold651154_cov52-Prasinocladus_malaysianus.AAC.1
MPCATDSGAAHMQWRATGAPRGNEHVPRLCCHASAYKGQHCNLVGPGLVHHHVPTDHCGL